MNNTDIIIKPADKGGAVVIMNFSDYDITMNNLLSDDIVYEKITPTVHKKIIKTVHSDLYDLLMGDNKMMSPKSPLETLNEQFPGLQFKLIRQSGPLYAPVLTVGVEIIGKSFEASGPSKKTAKHRLAEKVLKQVVEKCMENPVKELNSLREGLEYKELAKTGDRYNRCYVMEVEVDGHTFTGRGRNKKKAKENAAMAVLRNFWCDKTAPAKADKNMSAKSAATEVSSFLLSLNTNIIKTFNREESLL
ncbi:interleukin enhancer-binding factor 3-like [Protopterus annectens]|uniref:interleukin enhancer-binding factor 3-like n=1 Tax=Protopterus annectens TaxID=7888 RepID=UPI001CFB979E|nr:interleukin enhancer-binding factor 3-like [Protopterus annectens]